MESAVKTYINAKDEFDAKYTIYLHQLQKSDKATLFSISEDFKKLCQNLIIAQLMILVVD